MAQAHNTLRAYKAIIPHLVQMDQEERIRFHQDGSYWCNKKVPELTHPTDRVCSRFSRKLVALVSGVRHALSSSRCAIVQSCNTVSFEPPELLSGHDKARAGPTSTAEKHRGRWHATETASMTFAKYCLSHSRGGRAAQL